MKPIHIKSGIIISKENYDSFLLKKYTFLETLLLKDCLITNRTTKQLPSTYKLLSSLIEFNFSFRH